MRELASLFAQADALALGTVAALVAIVALFRKRRPVTRSRVMDVGLSALLFVFMGVRYAILAALVAIVPSAVLPGAGAGLASLFAGIYAAAAVVGLATYRGGVGARAAGAGALGAVAIVETVAVAAFFDTTVAVHADTVLSLAIAAAAGIFAAFFWSYRTATPKPLGSDKRPFDY